VIVAPGGTHRYLSIDTDGANVPEWLNSIGVAAFVLKYRTGSRPRGGMEPQYGNTPKVGFMGLSAGGEVAVPTATKYHAGRPESPDPLN
jgi:hypothetical protein